MEGVEDIPGIVMTEGLAWDWESFPEYLDALDSRPHDIDIAALVPHCPLRVFVMGERGINREPATARDISRMSALVAEAISAGALGFSSSRATLHRASDGRQIPSYQAAIDELVAVCRAMNDSGGGFLQVAPELPHEPSSIEPEKAMIEVARLTGIPLSITCGTLNRGPRRWLSILDLLERAGAEGLDVCAQILPRPVGVIIGLQHTVHPFSSKPSFKALADLPLSDRVGRMRDPRVKATLIAERPMTDHPLRLMIRDFDWIFPLDAIPNYEPEPGGSVAAKAAACGISAEEMMYDLLLEDHGRRSFLVALANLYDGSLDEMTILMDHKHTTIGLGDGGAHYGMICDSSYPTFMLTHWTRERRGRKYPLEQVVRMLSAEPARRIGLRDRGILAPGYKAHLNVIDYDRLRLMAPYLVRDLPGGGQRLDQRALGYVATVVGGYVTSHDDQPTSARPGRLIRGRTRPLRP
jgi:N-acyl-D-aspartate/D-glutamate deacylase